MMQDSASRLDSRKARHVHLAQCHGLHLPTDRTALAVAGAADSSGQLTLEN